MLQTQYTPEHYTGTGALTNYDFTWRILTKAELVAITKLGPAVTVLDLNSDYTIDNSSVNNDAGGQIVLAVPLPLGTELFLVRQTALTQLVQITEGSSFPASVIIEVFDRLTMMAQELKYSFRQSLHFPLSSIFKDVEVADGEAGKLLQWNSDIDAIQNVLASALELTHTTTSQAIAATATTATITHNLGSATAKLIGFSTTWQTGFRIVSQTINAISIEFNTECPAGGGTLVTEVAL